MIEPNRGARVRPIDESFVRDIIEIEVLIEPALTRWFVSIVDHADIERLEAVAGRDRGARLRRPRRCTAQLDTRFHQIIYDRHYNRHAAELWWKHREILRAISRRFPTSLSRRQAVIREHRELIERIRSAGRRRRGGGRRPPRRRVGAAHHRADGRGQAAGRDRSLNGERNAMTKTTAAESDRRQRAHRVEPERAADHRPADRDDPRARLLPDPQDRHQPGRLRPRRGPRRREPGHRAPAEAPAARAEPLQRRLSVQDDRELRRRQPRGRRRLRHRDRADGSRRQGLRHPLLPAPRRQVPRQGPPLRRHAGAARR